MEKILLLLPALIFSLTAYQQKVAVQQDLTGLFAPVIGDLNIADAPVKLEIVTQPGHGTIDTITLDRKEALYNGTSVRIPWFRYIPERGFSGKLSFSYRVHTSTETTPVITSALSVYPPEPGNMTVLLIVCDTLLQRISGEVNQMKVDMESEGYTARIISFPRRSLSTDKQLWDTLVAEYDNPDRFMAGAILIGALPTSKQFDKPFWYMTSFFDPAIDTLKYGIMHNSRVQFSEDSMRYDFDATNAMHIWISRIVAYNGESARYGKNEAEQLKRYFKANHEYRKGITRYQRKAYFHFAYPKVKKNYSPEKYLTVFPSLHAEMDNLLSPREYAYAKGGELLDAQYHGNQTEFRAGSDSDPSWPNIYSSHIYEYPMSIRFYFGASCKGGNLDGITASQLYTRNGGCLLATSSPSYGGEAVNSFVHNYNNGDKSLAMIGAGERWGRIAIRGGVLRNAVNMFYGDLSLKTAMAPDNKMPAITSCSANKTSGMAPLAVNFSVAASDSDGTISGYEWYPSGFNFGLAEPSVSGSSATTAEYTFTKPYLYKARVEAIDNWNARARHNMDIAVAPSCVDTMRVNVYRPQSYHFAYYEYTDTLGRLWLHDQLYSEGTWGYMPRNNPGTTITPNHLVNYEPFVARQLTSGTVTGTKAPDVFKTYIMPDSWNPAIWYKIPLPSGMYRINFGFADCRAVATTKKATMDIEIEGEAWRTFSPYDSVGAKVACFVGREVLVTDGFLEFKISTSSGSTDTAFLNCFEIFSTNPASCFTASEDAYNGSAKTFPEMSVSPNPFNPATTISYYIPAGGVKHPVTLTIFTCDGRKVQALEKGATTEGMHNVIWNGKDLAGRYVSNGLYVVVLESKSYLLKTKIMLLK